MKTWHLIVAIIVILSIGVGVYFYFTNNSNQQTTTPTGTITNNDALAPDTFSVAFYKWYMAQTIRDHGFIVSDSFHTSIGNWLTPDFIAAIPTLLESGENPLLLAQDYQDAWATKITSSVVNQTSTEADVLVTLGDVLQQKLLVHLVKTNTTWRIASVSLPS